MFVIDTPEVLKAPTSDTYVVFGAVRVEDAASRAQSSAAEGFRMPGGGFDPELLAKLAEGGPEVQRLLEQLGASKFGGAAGAEAPKAVESVAAGGAGGAGETEPSDTAAEGEEDLGDINPQDVDLVVQQTGKNRAQAVRALKAAGGDIVNAIMELSDSS
jgi:nascent polypeptide-associated complex subunit alpha